MVSLLEIEKLRKDLTANIEKGHYEDIPCEICRSGDSYPEGSCWGGCSCHETYVIDHIEPDIEKRETARKKLKEIYETSSEYSKRYLAGMTLKNISPYSISYLKSYVDENMNLWIRELETKLKSSDCQTKLDTVRDIGALLWLSGGCKGLQKLLEDCYESDVKELRVEAGKQLGYSKIRILLHELLR